MAQIPEPAKTFRVDIFEYERGWGSKIDEQLWFDNQPEAVEYINNFNSRNTADSAPDWYMVARSGNF